MNCNEYQSAAMRTAKRADGEEIEDGMDIAIMALGLAGEAGEVADLIKKTLGHGRPTDTVELAKELGDVLWYLAVLAKKFNISLESIAVGNIEKLKRRYPDGFTHAASNNRSA